MSISLLCIFFTQAKSQTDLYSSIQVNALATDYTVTAEDKIITLVTCMGKQPGKRLLVQAVLQN